MHDEWVCTDHVATGENFTLQRCVSCSFLFTNPRPEARDAGRYYQSDNYVSHVGNKDGFSFMYKIYDLVRDFSIRRKIRLIRHYHPVGDLMDLGCGLGYFLDAVIRDRHFTATGVDISEDAIRYVEQRFGHHVLPETSLEQMPEHSFDVITQWHVLEHVYDLNGRMQQLYRLLKPGGTLFIAVPNSASRDAQFYGSDWDGYDVPRHLYHFNRKTFGDLMGRHGFRVIRSLPLWFDAPYISMRSETHRGKSLVFIRGAIAGSVSNLSACVTGDFSSMLFVVKKK